MHIFNLKTQELIGVIKRIDMILKVHVNPQTRAIKVWVLDHDDETCDYYLSQHGFTDGDDFKASEITKRSKLITDPKNTWVSTLAI